MASKVKEYGEVLTFFILETLAFTSFTLGNNIFLYFLFAFLTFVMILLFNSHRLKELDWTYYLIFLIPLFLFGILSGFNKFALDNGSSHYHIPAFTSLMMIMSLLIFTSVGYLARTIKGFKISTAMMTIYGGLSIITLIALIYGMVKYAPFYTMIYEGYYIYYEGVRIPIWDHIPFLMGFAFEDVSIQYFQLFGTMLFTSVVGLRYISPKKETKKFIFYLIFATIGFISILFTINKLNIITDLLVIAFLLFLVFVPKNGKILKPIFYVGLALVGSVFIIFFINAQSSWAFASGLQNAIASNSFLNRLFNSNRISAPVKELLDGAFSMDKLFSHTFNPNMGEFFEPSGLFLFDAIIFSGTLGMIVLCVFLGFLVANLIKYYNSDKDSDAIKNIIVGFIGSFFIYSFFALDSQPYSHYADYIPLQHNALFFITLLLIGYTFVGRKEKETYMLEADKEADEDTLIDTQEIDPNNQIIEMEETENEEINL